jgi:hypothetical protein
MMKLIIIIPFNFGKEIKLTTATTDNNEEKIYVTLKLNKNISRLLRIFANIYAEKGSTEEKRIDNFLSEEVTKIIQSLAADPPTPPIYPYSLKQLIQDLLHEYNNKNNTKEMEDLK